MDLKLKNKCAIVTGGSRGIGKQAARSLSMEGARVVITSRNLESLQAVAAEISAETKNQVIALACDTGEDASVHAMVTQAQEALGGIDILVNCAAPRRGPAPRLAEINDENFMDDMNVKVLGYLRCIRECAPLMAARGGGRIINISGLGARQTGTIIGSVRNIGVSALTKNVADELSKSKITTCVVHPGIARTERSAAAIKAEMESSGLSEAEAEAKLGGNLLGRLVDSAEIGEIIAFLASPKAVAINGDAVSVGGGIAGVINY
jgi:NAD(P)-dependent dehydrogenase (short-subunit alcohol dehydrogenase family)